MLGLAVVVPQAVADDAAGGVRAPVEAVRAEIERISPLYELTGPVRVRFTLINASDEPIVIPMAGRARNEDGIGLPEEVALGTPEQPLVTVFFEDEPGKALPPPTIDDTGRGGRRLRLAPHASLGAEVDLRRYYPHLRYAGAYRIEWAPLGGVLGSIATEFRVEPRKDVIVVTDYGKLTFDLHYEAAPRNVANFLELVRDGFYNNLRLFRVVPGFVIQGGCPLGTGKGMRPDGKTVPAEFRDYPVDTGTLLMARKVSNPDSASCQFFIAVARLPELDGEHTVIGQASDEESMRTLMRLTEVPTDRDARPREPLTIRSVNLVDAAGSRTTIRLNLSPSSRSGEEKAETPADGATEADGDESAE